MKKSDLIKIIKEEIQSILSEAAKEHPIGSVEVMKPGKTYVFAGGYITDDKQDEVTMKYEGLVGKKMKFTITKSTKYPQNVGHEILLTTKQVTFAINKLPYVKGLEEGKINESKVYKIETINKNGKSTIHHLPAESILDVNRTVELLKKSKNIADVKILGIKESLEEADSNTYTYAHDPKSNKYNVIKVSDGAAVTSFSTEAQAKSHVEKINKLSKGYAKIKGNVYEDEDVSISESQLDKNITDKIIAIFHKKYGKYPKIKEIIEAWLSDGDNWKKAYYTSGENYKNEVLKPIEDKIRQWGKTSIFKNRPAFNSHNDINEGPEEMGAYRRLVVTSPLMDKIKAEYTKFMARPEVKSMYPVRFKMIDSPKADTFVVDVEGDKATVVAIKLSDLAKKLDKSVAIMVRKERKLK